MTSGNNFTISTCLKIGHQFARKHSLPRKVVGKQWLNNLTSWLTDLFEGYGGQSVDTSGVFTELWMFFLHPMWPPSAWFQPWTVVTRWFWSFHIHWHFSIPTSHHFKEFVCIWSDLTSWSVKSSLKHFSHYCHVFFHSGHLVSAPHIIKALLPPNGCPSHKLWWWHCKKPRPAFGRFCRLSYPPLEHVFKYIWLSVDFWLAFLGARCIYIYIMHTHIYKEK